MAFKYGMILASIHRHTHKHIKSQTREKDCATHNEPEQTAVVKYIYINKMYCGYIWLYIDQSYGGFANSG